MAKTESTAVNDLIKIAATQTPLRKDPSEDLMFTVPPKKERSSKHALSPRGTDVPPLPRDRAPHGTQEHAVAMPAIKISSAPASRSLTPPAIAPTRSTTIPPLVRASDASLEPIATRPTRPSLPPPSRAPLPPPSRTAMPSEYPVVSAVHSLPMAPGPQAEPEIEDAAVPWADDGVEIDVAPFQGDSTAQVAKSRTNLAWMIKLAPVAAAMIVLGVVVGYLLLDRKKNAAAPSGTVEVKVVAEEAEPVAVESPAGASPSIAAPAAAESPAGASPSIAAPAAGTVTAPNLAAAAEPAAAMTPPDLAATTAPATPPTRATAPTAAAAVTTPSITPPAPTTAAIARRPVFVDVRIDSKPSGATVMLVDRGKQTFLGTTPISTAVDPTRAYEVVFSHPRRQTQIEHLDPKATNRLAVVLGKPGNRATPELAKPATIMPAVARGAAPAAKPVTAARAPVAKLAKPAKIIEPTWDTQPAWDTQIEKAAKATKATTRAVAPEPAKAETAPAPAPKAEKAVGGTGVLMISSKPPCEIHVDGKATGLMTPQRALSLSAGKHKITLVNPAQKIKKSFAVQITANESTKVIQDLSELMK